MRLNKFLLLAILSMSAMVFSSAAPRPNIVYFYADDLGWAGIRANQRIAAANGVDMTEISKVITPNIDKLVAGGINFTHAYGNPVCSPARACQQLGFHQGHTWADWNDPADDKAMRTQDPSIGKLLSAAGYRTGMYGKWGYGASQDKLNPVIVNEQTLPIHHGYHDCVVELHHVRAHTFLQPSLWYSHVAPDGTVELDTTLIDNKKMFPGEHLYADNYYTAGAIKFIRGEANGPSPFFAQLSFQVPHGPFDEVDTLPGWFDDYKDVDTSTWNYETKLYAANVTLMDRNIGRVLAALRDPNGDGDTSDSVMHKTLLIFSSDNGGGSYAPLKFFNGTGHLYDYKGSVAEGGIRDPLAFYWEGVIEPGQTTDHIACITDMFPTFCELAGIAPPVGLDGTSFAPLLTGEGELRKRPYFCYESPGRNTWFWSVVKDDYKLAKAPDGTLLLFDLEKDEPESRNLADDPAYTAVVNELLQIAMDENLEAEDLYANVWPTWVGGDGASVNAASSWKETGEWTFGKKWPQSATPTGNWNAVVNNSGRQDRTAVLETSISTLGFEVSGNPATRAGMSLLVPFGVTLEGRNEIRLSPHAGIQLQDGKLKSVRWVDILANASLEGSGQVDSSLYNSGTIRVDMGARRRAGNLFVTGDYRQQAGGRLSVELGRQAPLIVGGVATLDGSLEVGDASGKILKKGDRVTVLRAALVAGAFNNPGNHVESGAARYQIHYGETTVDLEKLN